MQNLTCSDRLSRLPTFMEKWQYFHRLKNSGNERQYSRAKERRCDRLF
ncbi:MAG TPA: hypothetical protein V6D50_18690 [Chroococcales cyanobacterium]